MVPIKYIWHRGGRLLRARDSYTLTCCSLCSMQLRKFHRGGVSSLTLNLIITHLIIRRVCVASPYTAQSVPLVSGSLIFITRSNKRNNKAQTSENIHPKQTKEIFFSVSPFKGLCLLNKHFPLTHVFVAFTKLFCSCAFKQ